MIKRGILAGAVALALSTVAASAAVGSVTKAAVRVDTNNFISAVNGTLSTLDTSGTVPSGLTTLSIGSYAAGTLNFANSYVRKIIIYPYAMTDAQLQAATA